MTTIKRIIFTLICIGAIYIIYDSIQHIRAEISHRNGFLKQVQGYPHIANKDYQKAVDLMPWETHYRLQLAKSYEATSKKRTSEYIKYIDLAIKEYEKLIAFDTINPWFTARLGLIYYELSKKYPDNPNHIKTALKYTKQATENDKKNPLFTMHYGHLLYNQQQFEDAKKYYLKTVKYDKDMTEARLNLATIYSQENDIKNAMIHYKDIETRLTNLEKQQKTSPSTRIKNQINTFQHARIKLATYYLKSNNTQEALTMINRLPLSIEKYELLAQYYEQTNNIPAAISIYKQLHTQLKQKKYADKLNTLSK